MAHPLERKYLSFISVRFVHLFHVKSWSLPLPINEFFDLAKRYASSRNKSHLFPSETSTYD